MHLSEVDGAIGSLRRRVDALEGHGLPSSTNSLEPVAFGDLLDCLMQGRKIPAIKVYREIFKVGLVDAKHAIDTVIEGIHRHEKNRLDQIEYTS